MKKSLLLVALLSLSSGVFGYTVNVKNDTKSRFYVQLKNVWCGNDEALLVPGETHEFSTGACCIAGLYARNWDTGVESDKGTSGGGCRNYDFTIKSKEAFGDVFTILSN